jgi:glycosyltransferase involved in cell wall biosynthesis
MSEKVLLLSWSVPPEITGSSIIVGNLARQFSREEMILAGEKPFGMPAMTWREEWPEICYVQSVWPVTGRGIRWWRLAQFPRLLWNCMRLIRRHRVTTVLVVFPSEHFLLAGYLAACWTGCRLLAYFHNTYYECRSGLAKRLAAWLQERVFTKAAHVFVMSEGMAEFYRERYPDLRQTPLVHSFNEDIPEFDLPAVGSPLRLAMSGSMNAAEDAAARLAEAVAATPDARLSLLTATAPAYLRALGILRDGTTHETVARDRLLDRLAGADIVLLPHGLSGPYPREEYATIFPTKTIEYLICGRPILAHCTAGSFLARFLAENDCALLVDQPDVNALRQAIARLRSDADLRAHLVRNALKTAEQFRAARVAQHLREWIPFQDTKAAAREGACCLPDQPCKS